MFKKTLSALAVACVMLVSAAAAGTIFPAEYTDIDGVTRAGYLDEDGMTVLPLLTHRQAILRTADSLP